MKESKQKDKSLDLACKLKKTVKHESDSNNNCNCKLEIGDQDHTHHSIVGWLFGFYGRSIFVGYLTPNPFLCK